MTKATSENVVSNTSPKLLPAMRASLDLELQTGYLYQNGVEFHQKVIGAGFNLLLGHLHYSSGGIQTFPSLLVT